MSDYKNYIPLHFRLYNQITSKFKQTNNVEENIIRKQISEYVRFTLKQIYSPLYCPDWMKLYSIPSFNCNHKQRA